MLLPHPSLRHGLVGAWCPSLGASGLTLIDRSGRNNHGTLTNMGGQDNWRSSGSGVALNFDGTNDYVGAATSSAYQSGSFSITLWQRRAGNVTQSYPGVMTHTNLLTATNFLPGVAVLNALQTDAIFPNRTYVQYQNATQVCSVGELVAGNDDVWNFYAAIIDRAAGTIALYKNGTIQQSSTLVSSVVVTRPVEIGRRSANTAGSSFAYATTLLDDIRIYSRALTAPEISLLASQRGIGLRYAQHFDDDSDLQKYPIATPPNRVHANVAGVWVPGQVRANEAGTWGNGETRVNQGGEWL